MLILVAAIPTLTLFVKIPSSSEQFSELWLLGPDHKAENYPFNVGVNETYTVYVRVSNRLGESAYYRILAKFRNQTQSVPVAANSTPSTLPALYEYNVFVASDDSWEGELSFRIESVVGQNNTVVVRQMSFNYVALAFDPPSQAIWDSQRDGFYYQLFLELWRYDLTSQAFEYDNRFVALWLNFTKTV